MPSIDVSEKENRECRKYSFAEGGRKSLVWLSTRERERKEGMHGDGAPRKETSVCNPHIGRSTIGPEGGGSKGGRR